MHDFEIIFMVTNSWEICLENLLQSDISLLFVINEKIEAKISIL